MTPDSSGSMDWASSNPQPLVVLSIECKKQEPIKLSFEEWYTQNPPGRFWNTGEFNDYLKQVWNAAQENK